MQSKPKQLTRCGLALALLALTLAMAPAQAQSSGDQNTDAATANKQAGEIARGDPSRWSVEDMSIQGRLRTLHKEIGAALQEAQSACRKVDRAERASCMKEARATYQRDMANAPETARHVDPDTATVIKH